jgi:excinuclease ABC subunit A
MPASDIVVKGAREHNLRDVDLVLPRNQLICLTGVSGSGKSSFAFDTVFAEGQRRYVESLSSFARQFLGQMPKPDVDLISGLSPSISIAQKSSGNNPRSTVGTVTEIYDYLRVLYARVGQGYCPQCDQPISAQSRDQIIAAIMQLPEQMDFAVLAPVVRGQKGEHRDLFVELIKRGFVRARVDGKIVSLSDDVNLDRTRRHHIEVVIDKMTAGPSIRGRLTEAVELALKMGKGTLIIAPDEDSESEQPLDPDAAPVNPEADEEPTAKKKSGKGSRKSKPKKKGTAGANDRVYSSEYACSSCGVSFSPPTPQMFSFNSPQGMCFGCDGLGKVFTFDRDLLVTDAEKSIQQGCIELLGKWRDLGRWKQHIYQGLADTVEREQGLEAGTMLETAWEELSEELQDIWLYGAGDLHITYTWRGGNSPMKYGGKFDGLVSELDEKYHKTTSAPKIRALEEYMDEIVCVDCEGDRLNESARHFRLKTGDDKFKDHPIKSLPEISKLSIADAHQFFSKMDLDEIGTFVAIEPLKEICNRLGFLLNVGLDYLALDRTAPTLSGGETQRIRLAGQIGAGLVGVLYILDEPSIGLHSRDNDRLISTLEHLRDLGNTVVVVEHDEDTMRAADYLIDFGPGPGVRGGEVVVQGHPSDIVKSKDSTTAKYLSGELSIAIPDVRREGHVGKSVFVRGCRHNNLRDVEVEIPLGKFVSVTGVSGSGKSSFVNGILKEVLREKLNGGIADAGEFDELEGLEHLDKMIAIDQSPIGRTPRSNPGTYIKLFDEIRKLYTQLPEAKKRGYKAGRFSFNVRGGRCEACEGNGSNKLEMDFLADVWVKCPVCQGQRFNRETLQIKFNEKSIADVLNMEVEEALKFFENIPNVFNKLKTLQAVGLDYLKIGQPSPTLSGGEAQRIKLARELAKRSTGKTLYLLDEPTTGLHFADIQLLLDVLQNFVKAGNTVLVVEHNLDVIKTSDWVIDLGPEGGSGGGKIVCAGTPEVVAACKESHTGKAIAKALAPRPTIDSPDEKKRKSKKPTLATEIKVRGAKQHNLKTVDVDIERDKMTVFCGPSGSGKSSMAMDTIYAEGQRRYVESLGSYARQFVNQLEKPAVEQIEGLSPAIAIEQKNLGSTPRSTVGTVTEIYDYLRILMARLGTSYCPECDQKIGTQTSDDIVDKILKYDEGTRVLLLAPVQPDPTQSYEQLWDDVRASGYQRVRVDNITLGIDELPVLNRRSVHKIEIVIDRLVIKQESRSRIADSVEAALSIGMGVCHVAEPSDPVPEQHWKVVVHSQHLACDCCGRSFEALTPHNFSFNSQLGWCQDCEGIGTQTGANPAAIMNDPELSLKEGAVSLWPNLNSKISQAMLKTWTNGTGIPIGKPFQQLDARQRRLVFYGTGDRWFDVTDKDDNVQFSFQYKGVFPTMEEASRLSANLRMRMQSLIGEVECGTCGGGRLRDDSGAVRFRKMTIDGICRLPFSELASTISKWKLDTREKKIAGELIREITSRVQFLNDVGLAYLTLNRTSASLSNGEAQRIRLASQLGSGLCGVLYVLDEPTIGLHPRDNAKLLTALHRLRDLGNTLIVVEHDHEVIANSDAICDFGPKAGVGGGRIVAKGTPEDVGKAKNSVTGPYLSHKTGIPIPTNRRPALSLDMPELKPTKKSAKKTTKKKTKKKVAKKTKSKKLSVHQLANTLDVVGAKHNNLKNIEVKFPLETLTVVTGPSGCGKSSLVNDILFRSLARRLHRSAATPGAFRGLRGIEHINKVIRVDQTPLGNSPSSNPATYTGAFDLIRNLFAELPDAKIRGYTAQRFSFNVSGGRCDECSGNGQKCIEMHFLPDVWIQCAACKGRRYNEETLAVRYNSKTISDVLKMSCAQAVEHFNNIPKIRRILQTLCDVGLDYVTLGQPAPTLSGGEAQRVKLSAELARPDTGRTLYLLDEPTTGLHFDDLRKLLDVLQRLVDVGNSVVLIEHNLDIIKSADWVIDMGPEAGLGGGQVVFEGTPEQLVDYAMRAKKAAESDSTKKVAKKATKKKVTKKKATKASKKSTAKKAEQERELFRSWTGEALAPVLAAGPYAVRKIHDPSKDNKWNKGDMEIDEVGENAMMPWEADGRRWHTEDRVGRAGEPVKWDGQIIANIVDRIEVHEGFADTQWNERMAVEICGVKKSQGFFFHAVTGDAWFVKMKFRVRPKTFNREELVDQIPLPTPNQMDDIPVYGNTPRVRLTNTKGKWQEIEIRAHSWQEIDIPAFWEFIDTAIDSFLGKKKLVETKIEDQTPWAKLGEKWHYMRKGFLPGDVEWDVEVLKKLHGLLAETVPDGKFSWEQQQEVLLYLPDRKTPWASIQTKKPDALTLQLAGPKDAVALGKVADLAVDTDETESEDDDRVELRFTDVKQVASKALKTYLRKHVEVTEAV